MLSSPQRCIYQNNQLGQVICQLRFPQILMIETQLPDLFQDAIREEYPRYSARTETPIPKIIGIPGKLTLQEQPKTMIHQFLSEDGVWRIDLNSRFIAISCSRYTCWEDLAAKLDKPLAAFIKLYRPTCFDRIGLRYLNLFSRSALYLEGVPFRQLIQDDYLGLLRKEDMDEQSFSRCSMDAEFAILGGCRAKIHAGPAMIKRGTVHDEELKFILDLDLFMAGKVQVNYAAGALQTLHSQAWSIFRGAITDRLHQAMAPELV